MIYMCNDVYTLYKYLRYYMQKLGKVRRTLFWAARKTLLYTEYFNGLLQARFQGGRSAFGSP